MSENHQLLTHGCYLVSTILDGRRYGMTCSWATQIEEKRILLVLGGQSSTARAIRASGRFGVSVFARDQEELALRFGRDHSDDIDKFDAIELLAGETGLPLLHGAVSTLECELVEDLLPVDGSLFIGQVRHSRSSEGREPLLLFHIDG